MFVHSSKLAVSPMIQLSWFSSISTYIYFVHVPQAPEYELMPYRPMLSLMPYRPCTTSAVSSHYFEKAIFPLWVNIK